MLCLLCKEFAEQECLLAESLRIFIAGEEVEQFIAEDCDATWFQAYHRHTLPDLRSQCIENILQQSLCGDKHTMIVEWTTTAQGLLWHLNLVPGSFEHFNCRNSSLWMKVVIKGVRPEDNLWLSFVLRTAFSEPLLKGLWRKDWYLALRRNPCQPLGYVPKHRCLGE